MLFKRVNECAQQNKISIRLFLRLPSTIKSDKSRTKELILLSTVRLLSKKNQNHTSQ
jgi:hypothetical protein